MKKTTQNTRTKISDLSAGGRAIAHEQLAAVLGGSMTCEPPMKPMTTDTLNSEGRHDTDSDCTSSFHFILL